MDDSLVGFSVSIAARVNGPACNIKSAYSSNSTGIWVASTCWFSFDIAFDKVLGNVPIIGIYFNAICAKQMAWRLGTLFAFMSARGSDIPADKVSEAMALIRHMFPQKDMFTFTTPNRHNFIKLVESVQGNSIQQFEKKVSNALELLTRGD